MPNFNRVKETRFGPMIYNHKDAFVGRSLDLYGEFSHGEAELFQQIVRPGDVVIDMGANIGAHTLLFSKLAGPAGAVLAFEPQRIVYQTLCGNMAINSVVNAHCIQAAVGEAPGQIFVPNVDPDVPENFGGIGLGTFTAGDPVEVRTLDSFNLGRCRLIKIDVEGMEIFALKGSEQTIKRLIPVLYVENDRVKNSDALIRYIASLDYRMFWHVTPLFNPGNFFKNPENVFGKYISRNMLCFHKSIQLNIDGFAEVPVP